MLTDDEIRQLWAVLDGVKRLQRRGEDDQETAAISPMIARGLQVLLLTGQRPGEVFGMKWEHVDLDAKWWELPESATKNHVAHRVPLTDRVVALLHEAKEQGPDNSRWVFAGLQGGSVAARAKKVAAELARATDDQGERLLPFAFHRHDLRRTVATNLAKAGISNATISRVLNHVESGPRATAVYQRYEFDAEKRAALEAWDRRVVAILATTTADVLSSRGGRSWWLPGTAASLCYTDLPRNPRLSQKRGGRTVARPAFCLVLLGVAAYLFLNGYHFWAVLCIAWLGYLALHKWLARVLSILSRVQSIQEEHGCNALLHCRFDVEKALAHRSVENLYDSLHTEGTVAVATFQDWISLLADNYRRKYKRDTTVEEVRFNVKNNVVFKNGEPDFWTDTIYHALDIPYVYSDGQEPSAGLFVSSDEKELSLRLFIVNGHLKLQVGEFSKRHSPRVLRDGSLAVYENWATVTWFPLIYFSYEHGLPVRCLNLSSDATDSYKEHLAGRRRSDVKRRFWKRAPDMFADWSTLTETLLGLDYLRLRFRIRQH